MQPVGQGLVPCRPSGPADKGTDPHPYPLPFREREASGERKGAVIPKRAGKVGPWGNAFLVVLVVMSVGTAYPRFELFHLAGALPMLALCFARGAAGLWRAGRSGSAHAKRRRWQVAAGAYVGVFLALFVWQAQPTYQHILAVGPVSLNMYTDLAPIADELAAVTAPGDRVFVFPDMELTANVYLLSQRLPAGMWAYTYPWYTTDEVVQATIDRLANTPVPAVVYFTRMSVDGQRPEDYAKDLADYLQTHYRPVKEIPWNGRTARIMVRAEPTQ
ncbi:MAG: hypothetical protein ACYC1C_16540 [Chloroflexota bacterium]